MIRPQDLLCPRPAGLYCPPGDFYIDPTRPVDRAVITHGHADHARAGHGRVLATPETLAIMGVRYGEDFAGSSQPLAYGETATRDGVSVTLTPAGHVLGSAQATVRWQGLTITVSGDYKRRRDPTCPPFEPVPSDVFVTEATFAHPRAPWALSVVYRAMLPAEKLQATPGKRLDALRWVPADAAAQDRQLAFDHAKLIGNAVIATRNEFDNLQFPMGFLIDPFTLTELQTVSEGVLGRHLDKSSFRRRLNDRGCLQKVTGEMKTGTFRPAQLYKLAAL